MGGEAILRKKITSWKLGSVQNLFSVFIIFFLVTVTISKKYVPEEMRI